MEEKSERSGGVHLSNFEPISRDVLDLIPETLVRKSLVVPLQKKNGRLLAATPNIKNVMKPVGLQMVAGCPVDLVTAPLDEIMKFIQTHYDGTQEQDSNPSLSVIKPEKKDASPSHVKDHPHDKLPESVLHLLREATKEKATEVLVHLKGDEVSVRYRIRGILVPSNKVFSKAAITEFFKEVEARGKTKSIFGTHGTEWRATYQENDKTKVCEMVLTRNPQLSLLTLRLSDQLESMFNPKKWGMERDETEGLEKLLDKKQGMVLFCGPEKDSVLQVFYGCLRRVVKQDLRALTVEDHLTEILPGVDQFAVRNEDRQFPELLRMALVHRPDVLGVHPVDQKEKFDLCFRGGMKGTMVLARGYALDAADIFYQLITMKLEPYMVGSALNGVVIQQTIRLICESCKTKDKGARDVARELGIPIALRPPSFYRGEGCQRCGHTGFDQESSIFEVVTMNDDIRMLLTRVTTPEQIRSGLKSKGVRTLRQAAIHKALNGFTSLAEVVRVTSK